MAFFKNIRDHLKANGFMTHLELAVQNLNLNDVGMCEYQLRKTQEAMIALRKAEAEYIFSEDGLQYVANLAAKLQAQLDAQGCNQLARDAEHIAGYVSQVLTERLNGK